MPDTSPTVDLDALRKLADAASPGPWEVGVTYNHQRNAPFIAAARTAVPALLDLVAEQTAEIARLRDALVQVGWMGPYGIIPGGMDVDPVPHWQPIYTVRTW